MSSCGTTSACAENTPSASRHLRQRRNYLRVRGEYGVPVISRRPGRELPPRARRILNLLIGHLGGEGTTSACAENTGLGLQPEPGCWNYLRVRGEYHAWRGKTRIWGELPPRARRIRFMGAGPPFRLGTTSACAENTFFTSSNICLTWNYLRVRGEYQS